MDRQDDLAVEQAKSGSSSLTAEQVRAMQQGRGLGPLNPLAAQQWAADQDYRNRAFADSVVVAKAMNLDAQINASVAQSQGGASTAKYFKPLTSSVLASGEAPLLKFDLGDLTRISLPGSYGGDYTTLNVVGDLRWEGRQLFFPRMEITRHLGWLTRNDARLEAVQSAISGTVQQVQDWGAESYAKGANFNAGMGALSYGPHKFGADILNLVVGLPRLYTSDHAFPGLVDGISHPVLTAKAAYGEFKGLSPQDKVIAGVELFGPVALKFGGPVVNKLNSMPVLGANLRTVAERGMANLGTPRILHSQFGGLWVGNAGNAAETAAAAARMDLSAQFTVSKTPQGVRLQYGDPNGWSAVGGDSHGIIGFVDKDGILGVDVYASAELRTQYGSGRDMYNSMMTRLQQESVDITGIRGAWLKGTDSVNYAQYQSGLAAGLEPAQSALNTWTGKLAQSYGYGQVESITGSNSNVYVLFRKPGSGR